MFCHSAGNKWDEKAWDFGLGRHWTEQNRARFRLHILRTSLWLELIPMIVKNRSRGFSERLTGLSSLSDVASAGLGLEQNSCRRRLRSNSHLFGTFLVISCNPNQIKKAKPRKEKSNTFI